MMMNGCIPHVSKLRLRPAGVSRPAGYIRASCPQLRGASPHLLHSCLQDRDSGIRILDALGFNRRQVSPGCLRQNHAKWRLTRGWFSGVKFWRRITLTYNGRVLSSPEMSVGFPELRGS